MTSAVDESVRLRPLSIGEIFDRSITIYVRNISAFLIAASAVAVPYAVFQYFASSNNASMVQQILAGAQGKTAAAAVPTFSPWYGLSAFVLLLVQPFMYVAIASLVGRIFRNEPRNVGASYLVALRHTGGIILTLLCAVGVYIAGVLAIAFVAVIGALLASAAGWGVMLLFAPIILAAFLALLLMFFALGVAMNAIGVDEMPGGRAISEGFSRIFTRGEWKKALLLMLAVFAVEIGIALVSLGVEGLSEMVFHAPLLDAALMAALTLFSNGFVGALFAVYYFDLRVRRDGLDVIAALDSLTPQTAT